MIDISMSIDISRRYSYYNIRPALDKLKADIDCHLYLFVTDIPNSLYEL